MSSTLAVRRAVGAAIVLLYLLLAGLYALDTPPWQAPDEPAHFNYARHIAETGRLPELRDGDYPADYLEEIKTARFAPSYSIDGIRYESHQPPLYYLLASGVYRLGANLPLTQRLLLLRLFSVLLGGATIALIYATAIEVLPRRPWLAAAVGLVAATLPMHLTMTSAINSDALSELLIVAIGYRVLRRDQRDAWSLKGALLTGLLLGLAFLTKMQTYTAYGFVAVALLWDARKQDKPLAWLLRTGGTMLVVALLVAAPWLVRNMNVYGWRDPLAMARHAAVVQGQLTTSGYIEQFGRLALLKALPQTTFQSFWGQFGWMAVPMHPRIYQALALVCTLAVLGGASWLLRGGPAWPLARGPAHGPDPVHLAGGDHGRLSLVEPRFRPAPGTLPVPGAAAAGPGTRAGAGAGRDPPAPRHGDARRGGGRAAGLGAAARRSAGLYARPAADRRYHTDCRALSGIA